mmetsp:Transcript_28599/g.57800  ORF Transcript_28599/g.57800 Transcript_28599/m.57800 type:complete len:211 (-) Transcript_28599:111-743(-)
MQYSNPDCSTAFSWLFLSLKIFFITVIMRILNAKGAWSLESPAPIDVTIAMRFTPLSFMAAIMLFVPSVSIVSPTSLVFPPRATITPSMGAASKTLATSAALVTSPPMTVRFGSLSGLSASGPPDPFGITSFEGFLVRPITLSPSFNAWYTHSAAVKPDAPKTAIVFIFNSVLPERDIDLHEAVRPAIGLVWETKVNAEAVPMRQVNRMV